MKSYKILISDFDGTLAGEDGVISETVVSAIRKWIDSGHTFSIASGRQFALLKDSLKVLELKTPVIVRGGAEIVDPVTEELLYSQTIDRQTVKKLIEIFQKHALRFVVEKHNIFYRSQDSITIRNSHHVEYKSLAEIPDEDFPKIVVWVDEKSIASVENFFDEEIIQKFPQIHAVRSYSPLGKVFDITSKSATKHLAVLELSKILNIDTHDMVGIGDGYNDYPLLSACGYKIAMGSAPDELKAIADFVAPSYTEDGVAVAIEKLLAKK